jgi:hypothetical protein
VDFSADFLSKFERNTGGIFCGFRFPCFTFVVNYFLRILKTAGNFMRNYPRTRNFCG